jgi:hypothetical protein
MTYHISDDEFDGKDGFEEPVETYEKSQSHRSHTKLIKNYIIYFGGPDGLGIYFSSIVTITIHIKSRK